MRCRLNNFIIEYITQDSCLLVFFVASVTVRMRQRFDKYLISPLVVATDEFVSLRLLYNSLAISKYVAIA